ncbi:MAG: site-2 protease family protein [Clostridia bacterium]|nr:site-2 protease family protein [Clostridia bacterium]MBO7150300.1 site-2 protease family protein [Clostridia bacterium]
MYILIALLVFGFLILIHEFGHYLTARIFGVKIHEFAIGMGPKLVWYQSKKTDIVYSLRLFPIGGYVSMLGENEEAEGEDSERSLANKPAWQRLIVNAAGAAMNLFFGFLLLAILTTQMNLGTTTIAAFREPENGVVSSADSGLAVGDTILRVNGKRVHIADQLLYRIMHDGTEPVELLVRRGDQELTLTVTFPQVKESGQVFGDADFIVRAEADHGIGTTAKHAFYKSVYMVQMIWESLFDLLTGRYTFEAVTGPVGTTTVISDMAKTGGAFAVFYVAVVISINLGIFNLLPLPALDGGHILLILIEMVTRRKVPPNVAGIIDMVGLFLLLSLMVAVTFKDIFALF